MANDAWDLFLFRLLPILSEQDVDVTEEGVSKLIEETVTNNLKSHPYNMESMREVVDILRASGIGITPTDQLWIRGQKEGD